MSRKNRRSKLTPEQHAQREEQRRRAREERRLAQLAETKKQERRKKIRKVGTGVLVGTAVGAAALLIFKAPSELPGTVRPTEIQASDLASGETFDYDSPTPTSGPNAPGNPTCGVFAELEPEDAVNVLEHGGVVLWYDPADPSLAGSLETIAEDVGGKVAIAPNDELEAPVVATAWGRLKLFDSPTGDVNRFVEIYRDRAPKQGSCPG